MKKARTQKTQSSIAPATRIKPGVAHAESRFPSSDLPKIPLDQPGAFTVAAFCNRFGIGKTEFYKQVRAGRIQLAKSGGSEGRSLVTVSAAQRYQSLLDQEAEQRREAAAEREAEAA